MLGSSSVNKYVGMALVEFHQILLSSIGDESPKLLPLPILPGPSLALASLRRHFPHASALHYWLDPSTLVTLPKVCKSDQSQDSDEVRFSLEGEFFILPFLDPSVNFFVTERDDCLLDNLVEKDEAGLNKRVALLEDLMAEQREFFASIQSLLFRAVGCHLISSSGAETEVEHNYLQHWSSSAYSRQEVCADCGEEPGDDPKSCLNPESEVFFPSRGVIYNDCNQLYQKSSLNPNCKTFEPSAASNGNACDGPSNLIKGSETSNDENEVGIIRTGGLPSINFDENLANLKEKEGDVNNNQMKGLEQCDVETSTSTIVGGEDGRDVAVDEAASTVEKVVLKDQKCKSIRPKIILKVHGHRRS